MQNESVRAADVFALPDHPFYNHGQSTGVCQVCGGIAPDHKEVRLQDGSTVDLTYPLVS